MDEPPGPPTTSHIDWTEDGRPRSRRFQDVYFSAEDGLAESRAVYLQGCGLPDAWRGRRRFVVGELGFGTGLNVAALLDLWRRTREPGARIHIFTVEGFLLTQDEAARALAAWPELAPVAELLLSRWPDAARGLHRIDLPELDAILDVAVMDVEAALRGWSGQADAWFLDGFSPASNPEMWTPEILQAVADRSAPGASAATFTVAGHVRRSLHEAGFRVERRPGFGRKRERLEARLPGAPDPTPEPRVAIVGGGIAGAAAARAFAALGVDAGVYEAGTPGAGGSGNPAALVTPRLDAGLGEAAALFAQAFARATDLYAAVPGAVLSEGVAQLVRTTRDGDRFRKIARSDLFAPGGLEIADSGTVSRRLGEPAPEALDQHRAQVVAPARILQAWLPETTSGRVATLQPGPDGWSLLDDAGATLGAADVVVVAAALDTARLVAGTPLQAVRGQASWVGLEGGQAAAAWGGYVAPTGAGVLFGATHDRDDAADDLRAADHARNLATLAEALPRLAERIAELPIQGRASVRAVTPDRLPMAGAAGGGLHLLTGFGSRGFTFAPLLAEHVAALAIGAPSPLSRAAADLVAPDRFHRRHARRGRS